MIIFGETVEIETEYRRLSLVAIYAIVTKHLIVIRKLAVVEKTAFHVTQ